MNIVIPMAGMGSRFVSAGYKFPKPFIDVAGKPMIVRVMENLACSNARFILLARAEHIRNNPMVISQIQKQFDVTFVPIEKLTEGTACTALYARNYLDADSPVIIANSDQIIDDCFNQYLIDAKERCLDGSILTFIDPERNPKWSFAKLDDGGVVCEVKEKQPISDYATVGVYYFRRAGEMIDSIIQMIIENDRTNNEFYICPAYNYLIRNKKKIGVFNIDQKSMHGIGTPEDLNVYLELL